MAAGNLAVLEGIVMGRRSLRFALLVLAGGLVVALQSPIQAGQVGPPGRAGKKSLQDPADAVGRPRSPGQLHQSLRGRHAARAARRIRRPEALGHHGRRAQGGEESDPGQHDSAVRDAVRRAEQLVAGRVPPRRRRAGLAHHRSRGRQDSAADAGRPAARRVGAADESTPAAPTPTRIAASTIAASRAASPRPACRPSTATRRGSCRDRASSRSSTR